MHYKHTTLYAVTHYMQSYTRLLYTTLHTTNTLYYTQLTIILHYTTHSHTTLLTVVHYTKHNYILFPCRN